MGPDIFYAVMALSGALVGTPDERANAIAADVRPSGQEVIEFTPAVAPGELVRVREVVPVLRADPDDQSASNDIVVTGRRRNPADPIQHINEASFAATQAVDHAVVRPVALTFEKVVPSPARDGLGNFVHNLNEVTVAANFLLQHKVGKSVETVGRFAINTTIGVGGLFDIAKRRPFDLPRRRNGLADTLGFYGVEAGPYLYLPIVGSTTVRDLVGGVVDRAALSSILGSPFNQPAFTIPTGVGLLLDERARVDDLYEKFRASGSPYAQRRDFYLKSRKAEIDNLRGLNTSTS